MSNTNINTNIKTNIKTKPQTQKPDINLYAKTDPKWIETINTDFDTFLLDHAACERKASAMAMSMVSHYPDKKDIVTSMTDLAIEELAHFKQVLKHINTRGLMLGPDRKDPYIQAFRKHIRNGREDYLLDRLLTAGIIEARGHERFSIIADNLEPGPLQTMYAIIAKAEAKHHQLFVDLALTYFPKREVMDRLDELLHAEAKIIQEIPHRVALH
jgi:tRNA-(ms[2]io[6]A)-hydroxylase